MVKYDQKNPHHCYDLFEHSLRVVKNINSEGITKEQLIKLKVAAFFHDIGKPVVVEEKNGRNGYYGHAKMSAQIAAQILPKLGYTPKETDEILFYIEHHDDFIKYRLEGEDIWNKIEKE